MLYYATGVIMIPVLLFSFYCQIKVKRAFRRYSSVHAMCGMTGAQAAARLLQLNGITDVQIRQIGGTLTDYYDPKNKEICLSGDVYNATSVAAIGVACHEAGHACQHAQGYAPLKIRNAAIPATRIGSSLGIPLVLLGMVFTWRPLIMVGIVLYALVALFQLLTLPVEFNASHRALQTIESNQFLTEQEYRGAKKVLTAAALTYVAALASALATLLRLLLLAGRSNDR
ncbi:MAG: zinc metallopeptidase [Ruminococcaceae bacterium]|nr:zinc metallopeptidase [Oscillospiraceae bacterium]